MKNKIEIKIYYEDTDAGGVVYYANYLKYFERARTEFLEAIGVNILKLVNEGINFVVVRTEIDYIHPSKLADILEIETELVEIKKVSLTFRYEILRKQDKKLLVKGLTKLACVDNNLKPAKIPQEVYDKIKTICNL